MTPDERKNLVIKQKEWYERQSDEKKDEMRQRKRDLAKYRYYNHTIEVRK